MTRLENRSVAEFTSHIAFTTEVESRIMDAWAESSNSGCLWYQDNGVDNNGGFVKNGVDTSAVDFIANINGIETPIEMKFVPTKGKLSLKSADIHNYLRQNANVLFVFNMSDKTLKVPEDKDIKKHWRKIRDTWKAGLLKWAIVGPSTLVEMHEKNREVLIPYMGFKPGIIVDESEYGHYFRLRRFRYGTS